MVCANVKYYFVIIIVVVLFRIGKVYKINFFIQKHVLFKIIFFVAEIAYLLSLPLSEYLSSHEKIVKHYSQRIIEPDSSQVTVTLAGIFCCKSSI